MDKSKPSILDIFNYEEVLSSLSTEKRKQRLSEIYDSIGSESIHLVINHMKKNDGIEISEDLEFLLEKTSMLSPFAVKEFELFPSAIRLERIGKTNEFYGKQAKTIKDVIYEIFLNNKRLFEINPRKFEEIVAELLFKRGFKVDLTKQTKDGGFDILALSHHNDMPLKYLVECKRFKKDSPVGIEIVRSFCDVVREEKANKGIIFTTSYFSQDAKNRQKANPYFLELKDHDDVIRWVSDYINC